MKENLLNFFFCIQIFNGKNEFFVRFKVLNYLLPMAHSPFVMKYFTNQGFIQIEKKFSAIVVPN